MVLHVGPPIVTNPGGNIGMTSFGEPGSCIGQFQSPSAIVVDGEGMCLVVDTGNNRLQVMDSDSDSEYRCVGIVKTDWPLFFLIN